MEQGIPRERIIVESASVNTSENFSRSKKLIDEHFKGEEPNIAFATTNYHVFRSGILAYEQGIKAQGAGSRTRSYFWINAFVREFIANLVSEWRMHLLLLGVWFAGVISAAVVLFFCNNI